MFVSEQGICSSHRLCLTNGVVTLSQVIDLATDFKVPGADQKGFFYLRDVVDGDAMVAAIAHLKETDGKVRHRPGVVRTGLHAEVSFCHHQEVRMK